MRKKAKNGVKRHKDYRSARDLFSPFSPTVEPGPRLTLSSSKKVCAKEGNVVGLCVILYRNNNWSWPSYIIT